MADLQAKHSAIEQRAAIIREDHEAELNATRVALQAEERIARMQLNAARRLGMSQLGRAWTTWRDTFFQSQRTVRLIRAAIGRLTLPKRAAALSHWRHEWELVANRSKADREQSLEEQLRLLQSELAARDASIQQLEANAASDHLGRIGHLHKLAAKRMQHRDLSKGWITWQEGYLARRAALRKMRAAALRFGRIDLCKGWTTWRELYYEEARTQRLLKSAAGRLSKPQRAAALALWKTQWQQVDTRAALERQARVWAASMVSTGLAATSKGALEAAAALLVERVPAGGGDTASQRMAGRRAPTIDRHNKSRPRSPLHGRLPSSSSSASIITADRLEPYRSPAAIADQWSGTLRDRFSQHTGGRSSSVGSLVVTAFRPPHHPSPHERASAAVVPAHQSLSKANAPAATMTPQPQTPFPTSLQSQVGHASESVPPPTAEERAEKAERVSSKLSERLQLALASAKTHATEAESRVRKAELMAETEVARGRQLEKQVSVLRKQLATAQQQQQQAMKQAAEAAARFLAQQAPPPPPPQPPALPPPPPPPRPPPASGEPTRLAIAAATMHGQLNELVQEDGGVERAMMLPPSTPWYAEAPSTRLSKIRRDAHAQEGSGIEKAMMLNPSKELTGWAWQPGSTWPLPA